MSNVIRIHKRAEITSREVELISLPCGHCPKEAGTILNGVLHFKPYHAFNTRHPEAHPTSFTLASILDIYVRFANVATIREIISRLEREIDKRLGIHGQNINIQK